MKKTKKSEETTPNSLLTLKFKLTNLRQSHFPDPLTKTDYLEFEIGDYLEKGDRRIFKIVDIKRTSISAGTLLGWKTTVQSQKPLNNKLLDLLNKYIAANNYGVCEIEADLVLLDGVAPKRRSKIRFMEMNLVSTFNPHFDTQKADIKQIISDKEYQKSRNQWQRDKYQGKIDNFEQQIRGLQTLLPPAKIEIVDDNQIFLQELQPCLLLATPTE